MTDALLRFESMPMPLVLPLLVCSILLNIPINYQASIHPMNLLPASASIISHFSIADLFTRPLPISTHHRYSQLVIGDDPTTPLSASAHLAAVASVPTGATASDSVSSLHPNFTLPIALDTGASISKTSDFTLEIAQASYGLIRSALDTSVVSKVASTPTDPYTLITGEDTAIDLSSPDTIDFDSDLDSDSGPSFTKVSFDIRQFGTASLTFIYSKSTSELLRVFVEPTQVDWLHWVPLPRLILPESYFHIFGLDYLQAFTLLHLIPIWFYYLLHFAVNLD